MTTPKSKEAEWITGARLLDQYSMIPGMLTALLPRQDVKMEGRKQIRFRHAAIKAFALGMIKKPKWKKRNPLIFRWGEVVKVNNKTKPSQAAKTIISQFGPGVAGIMIHVAPAYVDPAVVGGELYLNIADPKDKDGDETERFKLGPANGAVLFKVDEGMAIFEDLGYPFAYVRIEGKVKIDPKEKIIAGACWYCLSKREDIALKACSRCYIAKYCSPECNKAGWPKHKKTCVQRETPTPKETKPQVEAETTAENTEAAATPSSALDEVD
ncbi:Hypothetical protein POVN_LOCUS319 [uncultured virus]|nr:Hypothetical protein POVN_LOCUS319 [uncultured virus]